MLRFAFTKTLFLVLGLGLISIQVGCVALNIPSERLADPEDGGGVLGDWKQNRSKRIATKWHHAFSDPVGIESTAEFTNSGEFDPNCQQGVPGNAVPIDDSGFPIEQGFDGGALAVAPFDSSVEQDGSIKAPEIPWPRFHPMPTRPVFGGGTH
ncbi:hypothetical protein SH528x_000669 [Novipirellula sp. SH528]|uniref:hypothetical protein n=1 Tax=Novipirellula sp. SH528 TaxID=3454466 RepID=UPI003F9F8A98